MEKCDQCGTQLNGPDSVASFERGTCARCRLSAKWKAYNDDIARHAADAELGRAIRLRVPSPGDSVEIRHASNGHFTIATAKDANDWHVVASGHTLDEAVRKALEAK